MQSATFDYTALAAELASSKYGQNYAPFIAAGSDNSIARLLNAVPGTNTPQVSLGVVPSGQVILMFTGAMDQLASGQTVAGAAIPATTTAKWQLRVQALLSQPTIDLGNAQVQGIIRSLVTDGLLAATPAFTRPGTIAEGLYGAGTVLDHVDVARALRPKTTMI